MKKILEGDFIRTVDTPQDVLDNQFVGDDTEEYY